MYAPFIPFSQEHLHVLLIGFAGIVVVLMAGRRGGICEKAATNGLAWINLAAWPISLVAAWWQGGAMDLENLLPFHLCDVAAVTAGLALLTKRFPLFRSLTYFWGLAGTIQGLVTPAIRETGPIFFSFFLQHFTIVAAALYLPIVLRWRPRRPVWKAVGEVFAWSVAYLLFAIVVNAITGANFAYVSHPPANPSLLDHLGPWPWYVFSMLGIALVFYTLLWLPFARSRPTS
ncbi:MAG: TIGR02206 family membrane protein [Verrucomicrobiales bacterium]|nr:TIGR02206 family membrane protein [Verrucomicrobiales bacterium]